MKKKIFGIGLLVIAVVCLVFSILCFNMEFDSSGSYESYKSYGGDAYTGIQNAAAQTANNVKNLSYELAEIGNSVTSCIGYGFIVTTLFFVAVGLYFLLGEFSFFKAKAPKSKTIPQIRTCSQCGAELTEETMFCTKCGAAVDTEKVNE